MKYRIHPDLKKAAYKMPFCKPLLYMSHLPLRMAFPFIKTPAGVSIKRETISDNENAISAYVFRPENAAKKIPCLLYFHGGGFGYEAAPYHKVLSAIYAKHANCAVIMPNYRLLPAYPFPAAKNDALNSYKWVLQNARRLNIDINRIAVGGDSAGCVLAAHICRSEPAPCFQMLIYPVADAKMSTRSMRRFTDTPLWNSTNNRKMWSAYLNGSGVPLSEISPLQMKLGNFVPNAYIETAEFDCLHDEGILYARKLRRSGSFVELNETRGTFHGYDIVLGSPVTKKNVSRRIKALRRAFGTKGKQ